jgi:hypothetical protein
MCFWMQNKMFAERRHNMRKLPLLIIPLFTGMLFAQLGKNTKCTLVQMTDYHTTTALAAADLLVAMNNIVKSYSMDSATMYRKGLEAQRAYKLKLKNAQDSLPPACELELRRAIENPDAACMSHINAAAINQQPQSVAAAQEYLQTGDRASFESSMRANIQTMLKSIPRTCWFQSLTETPNPPGPGDGRCPQLWSDYDSCVRKYKMCLASGRSSCSYTCEKPDCSR